MTKKCHPENPLLTIILSEDNEVLGAQGDNTCLDEKTSDPDSNVNELNEVGEAKTRKKEVPANRINKRNMKRGGRGAPNPYLKRLIPLHIPDRKTVPYDKSIANDSIRIKELHNRVYELKMQLDDTLKENTQLKTLQKRHEIEIKKLEDCKADLPRLVKAYQEEHRILTVKLKELKSNFRELEKKLKLRDEELLSLKMQNSHLVKLTKDKHLLERERLSKKVEHLELQLKQYDDNNKKLSKKNELADKRLNNLLKTENIRHKETKSNLSKALRTIEALTGRPDNFLSTGKQMSGKCLDENGTKSKSVKGRLKSEPKIGDKNTDSSTSLNDVAGAGDASKLYLTNDNTPGSCLTVDENHEIPGCSFEGIAQKTFEGLPPDPADIKALAEAKCELRNATDDLMTAGNLDWDDLKRFVRPRKDELIVKIENLFEHDHITGIDDSVLYKIDSDHGSSDLEAHKSMKEIEAEKDVVAKDLDCVEQTVESYLAEAHTSRSFTKPFTKRIVSDLALSKEPELNYPIGRKNLSPFLQSSNRKFDDIEGMDNRINLSSEDILQLALTNRISQPSSQSVMIDDGESVTTNSCDKSYFSHRGEQECAKTKKTKNADILKYIFGKEFMFDIKTE